MARAGHCFLCRKAALDMPISISVGVVKTPEFSVKRGNYEITIQVERRLPLGQLDCLMGTDMLSQASHCKKFDYEALLEADWMVWDGDHVVAQGNVSGEHGKGSVSDDTMDRYLGSFKGESNKKYVLEVKFKKDGTALNVTHPHLIVMLTKPTDI
jgi:hypothetical protein